MNYRMLFNVIGKAMLVGAIFMLIPMLVGFCYGEFNILSYLVPVAVLCVIGISCVSIKPKEKSIFAKEGFIIVAFCWVILSLVGALPFVISGAIPNYIDALFETVSGFTTTGASILTANQIDSLYLTNKGLLFWRSFTHFIGGMGVLVFVLALFPKNGEGAMHVFRAESPGPSASKFASKLKHTATVLYVIYTSMTAILFVLLL
ncbi:MAG: TrkH family potassium uptake protein, partial [Clostridia bacterium]|nr:TrkH family potassium uptake protein [Clostridia bacterium]